MTSILVVDDEVSLATLLAGYLKKEGFDAAVVHDGDSALARARETRPEVVILDVMLPGMDGIEVCRELRKFSDAYVIMLTARTEEIDKIVGLSVGADDYVTKPYSPRELVARVKAMLRRPRVGETRTALERPIKLGGNLVIDPARHEVSVNRKPVQVTAREFALLTALASRPGSVLTRPQLLDEVWGNEYYDDHLVDVHIGNLRRKLEAEGVGDAIETVRGIGYRLATAAE
ncbi:MAG TPA: response regulator transcription factor [Chloroflexota bacterium]